MINIILRYKNNLIVAFKISGHSKNYICSCVSFLIINTINSIENFTNDKFICKQDKSGIVDFHFELINDISNESKLLLNSLELGLMCLEKKYFKFVRIKKVLL
jgi:uncharacterized protein YsxB (DUF464 family)